MTDLTHESAEFFARQIGHAFARACGHHLSGEHEKCAVAMEQLEALERRKALEMKGRFSPKQPRTHD